MKLSTVFIFFVVLYISFDTIYSISFSEASKQRDLSIIDAQVRIEARLSAIENNQLLVIRELAK